MNTLSSYQRKQRDSLLSRCRQRIADSLRYFAFLFFMLLYMGTAKAQTTLAAGDIAFIGYQTNVTAPGGDGFSFVTLKDMPFGEKLYFTEQGWGGNNWMLNGEMHLEWSIPSGITKGTIVTVLYNNSTTSFSITYGTLNIFRLAGQSPTTSFLSGGDQIIAYQSTTGLFAPSSPIFIAAVHGDYNSTNYDNGTSWNSSVNTGAAESLVPTGLTNGINCVSLFPAPGPEVANSKYTGTLTGTAAAVRASINNYLNWGHHASTDLGIVPSNYPTPNITVGVPATLTTTAATNIGAVKATLGGNVILDGGANVTDRGIVWGTSANPTIANNKVVMGAGTGVFSATVSNLTAGTTIHFRAYATNGAGTSYGADASFTTAAALTATASKTDVSCNGGGNGTATVVASGGVIPYTYSWSPSGGINATATGLSVGPYTCTITDGEGTEITRNFTITQPPALNGTVSTTSVSCFGGANGTATVTPSSGSPGYTYLWSTGATTPTITGLIAGTYSVTITDANTCTKTINNITITQPAAALNGTASTTSASCFGGGNGTATVTPSGGTPGYTYSWAPSGGTAATATGLAAGTYSVTITDANSCTKTISGIVVGQPAAALDGTASTTTVSCFGGSNGTATVVASGGTPGYTYSWSPSGGTAATATGLAAGTYSVTITDANSCTKIITGIVVGEPASALSAATGGGKTDVSCNGGGNGTATVAPTGGTLPYTYSWAPSGGTNATASGLSVGVYTVTVTDANGCTTTRSFTITQPTALSAANGGGKTDVSCNGGANGTATVAPTGGTPAYTYSWAPSGGTGATATGLTAGTYTVTVTDANACQTTRTFTINQPATALSATIASTNVSCNGGGNGTATVVVSGGTPSYTYSWAPSGGTNATATGLGVGTYTCTITDANACSITRSVTITQPTAMSAVTSKTNVSCNGGSNGTATIVPSGGTGPYTYSWAPSGGTNATATGLAVGNYTVTVTDANNCTITRGFTITQPTAMNITTSRTDLACNGAANGIASVNVTGGVPPYSYSWAPYGGTASMATGLAAGTYTVTITDANSCTATRNFTILQPPALVASPSTHSNVSCYGGANGSAKVTVTGGTPGYSYSWAPSGGTGATASGLSAGTYTVTVTDANACTTTQSFTITQPDALVATAGAQTDVSCNGGSNGSATVAVTGGIAPYTYSWSPTGGAAATATGLMAGTYTVTVTDANACTTTQSFTITESPALVATPVSQTNLSCYGGANGSATVEATGGTAPYTYSWSPTGGTAATATGLMAGTYTVTVTDANACSTTQSFTITQPSALVVTPFSQTNIACNGAATGSATVTVAGGTGTYTYSWAPSGGTAATATGLAAGTYTVTVTDANACFTTQSFTITQPSALVATAANQTNVSCYSGANGSATVAVTGGTPGYTYSWAPSGGTGATATGLSAGTYTVTVTDANACTTTQSFTIAQPNALVATASSQTNVSCNGGGNGAATVAVTGGTAPYTYSWSPTGGAAATATGLSAGTYTVTVTDANACTTTQSFTITESPSLVATAASQTNVSCYNEANGSATVAVTGGTGTYTYSWAPSGGTAATATGLSAGTYTVTVTDANACTTTQSFTITQPSALVATAASQTDVSCNGGANGSATVAVTGGTGTYTYSWAPSGGTAATATGLSAGTYTVTVTDANACTTTQSFTLMQPAALVATADSQTDVSCNGGANGSATVGVTGGTGTYTYSWAPSGGTAATATGLSAGTYTVTIKDANLCETTQTFTIIQPTALVATAASQTDVSCNGGSNGAATVAVTGGTAPYTYSWSPTGGATATATGLMAGTYTVTVTDANGCTTTQSFTIIQPSATIAVQTVDATLVFAGGATLGGDIGNADCVVEKGIVYGTMPIPTVTDNKEIALTTGGQYQLQVSNLNVNTTYYYRAYAIINNVVSYGSVKSFQTIKYDQQINFPAIATKNYGDGVFALGDSHTDRGLLITYTAADPTKVSIVGNQATILMAGTTAITATQSGDLTHNAATSVQRTMTVAKAPLTVTADVKTKVYGSNDPALTYIVKATDLKYADAASVVSGSLERLGLQNVGNYTINNKNLTATNYAINYVSADLTITKAPLTVTADAKTKVFGSNDPALTYTVKATDLKYADAASVVSGGLERATGENVGSYLINNKNLTATNYAINYVGANLSITRATLTGLSFANKDFVYDGTTKSLQLGGTLPAGVTVVYQNNDKINAGTYEVTAVIAETPNYFGTSLKANLLIRKATQVITFTAPEVLRRDVGKVALDVRTSSGLPVTLNVDDPMVAIVTGTDLEVLRLGTVRVTASQAGNENYEAATAVTEVIRVANEELAELPIIVHPAVSPNGDGENEFLIIEAIRDYTDNKVTIFDKNGVVLAEIVGYDNITKVFWGTGHRDGTYFYYIDFKDGNTWRRKKGFFVIKR
ncbi:MULTISPECIES: MBG domain-containing protein [Sphingobacterium]|uniref:MBG domain-containing protein n=3 Tax=Sphingobacteriaceae TaxID=84566 RepID=UPI0013DB6CD8|nr:MULTISPECIES: MBG domain-containing protein [unclassified Sphingobacterium]